jgi:hypothetical protein
MIKNQPLWTKNKGKIFIGMKTNDFILLERKLKLTIKVEVKNIFYGLLINYF